MSSSASYPRIIQGGMGVAISGWRLARTVAQQGQLGVVSGTALDMVAARLLADGDPGGHLRRAFEHFPLPAVAEEVLRRYYRSGGRASLEPYPNVAKIDIEHTDFTRDLNIIANFAEVWLAKEGHDNPIGINFLEKIQPPIPSITFGAMLAEVDYVIMGAGIPKQMPAMISAFAERQPGKYRITVEGAEPGDENAVVLDPRDVIGEGGPLKRPDFLAIISSHTLAAFLVKDPVTRPDGFIIELPKAGGHNAPPRGKMQLDELGQPIYGKRDAIRYDRIKDMGLPFWIAGGYAGPELLKQAEELGAVGIQVGTAFAMCNESGLAADAKKEIRALALRGEIEVYTDPRASSSGYPFKIVPVPGTAAMQDVYEARGRICDLGYLRTAYKRDDGKVGYRCAAEPEKAYLRKGGAIEDTVGRKCLCNALMSNIGQAQVQKGKIEPMIVTAGDDLPRVVQTLGDDEGAYSATDVLDYLLGESQDS
jgi:NAD(P)H-dependent flavin oxidoreductase YrpB (nitropropane dioxygenase family)